MTVRTGKGLLTGMMASNMFVKVCFLCKRLVAAGTAERFLARMDSKMNVQLVFRLATLSTFSTFVLSGVNFQMKTQSILRVVGLVTLRALMWLVCHLIAETLRLLNLGRAKNVLEFLFHRFIRLGNRNQNYIR